MSKSQNSFIKKQKADKRKRKQQEKFNKKLEKKAAGTQGDFSQMIAYVDELGNIVDQPTQPSLAVQAINQTINNNEHGKS